MRLSRAYGAVFFALWAAATTWNATTFSLRAEYRRRMSPDVMGIVRPEIVKQLAFGYRAFIADVYWLRAQQYFGDDRYGSVAFGQLADYLDVVLALDPDYHEVYRFGGVAIPTYTAKGWVNADRAEAILEKGILRFPDDWKLRMYLAFFYSDSAHRYREAGDQLAKAANLPGAPRFLGALATRMYASEGDYVGAEVLAQSLLKVTTDPEVRKVLEVRLTQLETRRRVDLLQRAVTSYRERMGTLPPDLSALVTTHILDALPSNLLGPSFRYDPTTGVVSAPQLPDQLGIYVHP